MGNEYRLRTTWLRACGLQRLINAGFDFYPVELVATVAQLHGNAGIGDQAVAGVELLDWVTNGEYVLEYSYVKPFRGRVRVLNGSLSVLW
jgi:hypothetical protein